MIILLCGKNTIIKVNAQLLKTKSSNTYVFYVKQKNRKTTEIGSNENRKTTEIGSNENRKTTEIGSNGNRKTTEIGSNENRKTTEIWSNERQNNILSRLLRDPTLRRRAIKLSIR